MRTGLLLLLALAAPAFAGSTVWKWVDEKGVTHYSDRPVPGATQMEISTGKRIGSSTPAATPASGEDGSGDSTSSPSGNSEPLYRDLEIWQPAPEQTFSNTGGRVPVNIRLTPSLQNGHGLYLFMDGREVPGQPNALEYELADVERGAHTLSAVISDSNGTVLQKSNPVRFIVRQESVANPPQGPSLAQPDPAPRANTLPAQQPSYGTLNGQRQPVNPATNRPPPPRRN